MPGNRQQNDERPREKGYGNEIEVNKRTEVEAKPKLISSDEPLCLGRLNWHREMDENLEAMEIA